MRKFLVGLVLGLCVPLVGGYLWLVAGGMPVGTKGGPLPFERMIARKALSHAIGKNADLPSPVPADEPNLLAGAMVYQDHCSVCHGLPNQPPSAIARGMFPPPPQLMPPKKGVTDDPVGETYWKVKNGIRLTGMPGFDGALGEKEMWQVSQLLLNADKLPKPVNDALKPEPPK